jgi:preprotein translocase subunit SecB
VDSKKQPGIQFSQIYLNAAEFSHRADSLSITNTQQFPDLNFTIQLRVTSSLEPHNVAALTLRLESVRAPEAQYFVMAEITAIVQSIEGQENITPAEFATSFAPAALYPFLREAIANLTMRGRFGPVYLKPVNFTIAGPQEVTPTAVASVAGG